MKYKIIDLFAGPGGLCEGFSTYLGGSRFEIVVSAEMEASAHQTLTLRSFFRHVRGDQKALAAYYDFCNSDTARHPSELSPAAWRLASEEARQLTLGNPDHNRELDELLDKAHLNEDDTILIGGPPCQAYSLVGRARNKGNSGYVAEKDHRHFLYKEYLRILHRSRPAVFVMENVKGILSSKVNGDYVFHDILRDLTDPGRALGQGTGVKYTIHSLENPVSFTARDDPGEIDSTSFVIQAERHGIPQARHRVILLGVREDLAFDGKQRLPVAERLTVRDAIGNLPPLRSRLSEDDNPAVWRDTVIQMARALQKDAENHEMDGLATEFRTGVSGIGRHMETGGLRYFHHLAQATDDFGNWVADPRLDVILNHESRSHMRSDLGRYLYTSAFGKVYRRSPKGPQDFAFKGLAPNHANWESGKFADRFRVQLFDMPGTTVTSHIAKDGHYFIHPDLTQCRSLTVREAARLQTFPDNYFFQGNRTQQYHQVGNAVPPLLASKIADIVCRILDGRTSPVAGRPASEISF